MTDKQPEALIRADELEAIGAESSLARTMAAHTIRLLYKENEALRAALAQPPCATGSQCVGNKCECCAVQEREWQGLTNKEYEAMAEKYVTNCYFDTLKYARAIEAKLKEKNA